MLNRALDLASQGFHVFPCVPNWKDPALKNNLERASTDPGQVRAMWTRHGVVKPFNIGIATGKPFRDGYLGVLDIDPRHGGDVSLWALQEFNADDGDFATRTVTTWSGGTHFYFVSDKPIKTAANHPSQGLDTRGLGGYVVAPGSVIQGAEYVWASSAPVREMPGWLAGMISTARDRKALDKLVVGTVDSQSALNRAIAYLQQNAPLAVEGSGGDQTTFRVACRIRDYGVAEATALILMLDHWNSRCSPPWDLDGLSMKIANAYRYGQNPLGVASPENDFGPVEEADMEIPVVEAPPRAKLFVKWPRDMTANTHRKSLVKGWLDPGTLAVMYGDSNVGKSFVALDLAFCIATGQPWAGNRVQKGKVVYVAAEGGGSMEHRVEALKRERGLADFDVAVVPCPVDLLRPNADTKGLLELVLGVGGVVLVIIDTLSRALAGGNENGPEDMGAFVKNVDHVKLGSGACVMVVHHTGKDQARGARGHSLLRAATDTEIAVERGEMGGTITSTKQRDMMQGSPIGYALKSVELGRDDDGDAVTSAVVEYGEPGGERDGMLDPFELSPQEQLAFDALSDAIEIERREVGGVLVASSDQWLACFEKRYNEGSAGLARAKVADVFRALRTRLKGKGFVEEVKRKQWAKG